MLFLNFLVSIGAFPFRLSIIMLFMLSIPFSLFHLPKAIRCDFVGSASISWSVRRTSVTMLAMRSGTLTFFGLGRGNPIFLV